MQLNLPAVARYAVAGNSSPRLTECLRLAERVHLALVRLSDGAPAFTGCDRSGEPLQGHRHAYIFCECDPNRSEQGEVTHITVFARPGFGPREQAALQGLERIWGPDDLDVSLCLQGLGRPEDFAGESPLFARSRTWVSRTPFLPARHAKVTRTGVEKRDANGLQIGSPEHELRRLLGLAGFPEPMAVQPVAGTLLCGREVAWREFMRRRGNGEGMQAMGGGYGYRIRFPEEVQGPVAVGYASHFGMGGFESDKE